MGLALPAALRAVIGCSIRTTAPCLLLAATLIGCGSERDARAAEASSLTVAFLGPSTGAGPSALRGAELGAEEATRTGNLLGGSFVLRTATADDPAEAVRAAEKFIDEGADAITGGFDLQTCEELAELARSRDVLYLNIGCRSDALRAQPSSHVLHIEASDSMYLGAISSLRGVGGSAPVLWHAGLARYGAAQLNQRFLRRFGTSADGAAWASWLAMKLLWEASVGERGGSASDLGSRLVGNDAGFDGHKGEALRFDPSSGQLRQPLFPAPLIAVGSADEEADMPRGAASDAERTAVRSAFAAGEPLMVVSNEGSADLMILHAVTGQRLATIPFTARPRGIQISEDGTRVWVALSDESPTQEGDGDAIAEVDLREARVVATHAAGSDPEQFAVSRDGSLLVASNEDAGTATLIDRRRNEELVTLVVGIEPEGVAMSPDGRWVYVTAETSNTVSVIDTRSREVVRSFLVDERPRAAAFAPDGKRAYVTNEIGGTLTVIDVARHAVVASFPLARGISRPVGVVVSPDSRTIYVANGRANSVSIVDAVSLTERTVIPVGDRPWGIALSRDGALLYVANGGTNDVSVVDTRTGSVKSVIPVGQRPWGVVVTR